MRRMSIFVILAALCIPSYVAAQSYPGVSGDVFRQEGIASWYGPEFDGRPTASGEIFNSTQFTAAHPSLPFGTFLVVTNKNNNRQVTVRVNDRGPFVASRIIDLSKAAAEHLDMLVSGTAPVLIETMQNNRAPAAETPATQPYSPPPSVYTPYTPAPAYTPPPSVYTPNPPPPAYTPPPPAYSQPYPPPTAFTQEYPPAYYAPPPPAYYTPETPVYVQPPVEQAPPPPAVTAAPVAPPPPPPPAEAAPVPAYAPITVTVYPPPQAPQASPQPVQNIYQAPQSAVSDLPSLVSGVQFIPAINPLPGKNYRLQIGAYKIPRNAVDAFSKLKEAGLDPSYEQSGEMYRVVLANVRGSEMQSVSGKLQRAGFREVLIREE